MKRIKKAENYTKSKPLKLGDRQLLLIGYGSVGRPVLNRLLAWSTIKKSNVKVYDKQDLSQLIPAGIMFRQVEVVRKNYRRLLSHLKSGDIIIDLSLYISTIRIVKYCLKRGIHYINTSIEDWDHYEDPFERTIFSSLCDMRGMDLAGPTTILNHGANPGIVSHFTRLALDKLDKSKNKSHAKKAKDLAIETIHIAEIDTQVEHEPEPEKWRNTWSIDGYHEEGTAPPEIGYGSKEKKDGIKVMRTRSGIKVGLLPGIGWETKVKSSLPGEPYVGMLVQHAEAITISHYLALDDYRPSVYYVYKSCPASIESIKKFGKKEPDNQKILNHSNSDGEDKLGVLLLGKKCKHFYGSYCNSTESRKIFDGYQFAGPTSSQVVAGVLSALWLVLHNGSLGVLEPDDIPPKYTKPMIEFVDCLLGDIVFEEVKWNQKKFNLNNLIV